MSIGTFSDFKMTEASDTNTLNKKLPWHPALAVVFIVVIFFVAQAIAALIISIYPATQHWSSTEANNWLSGSATAQFVYTVLAYGIMLAAIYVFMKHYKTRADAIGLKQLRLSDPGYGLLAVPVYYILALLALAVVHALVPAINLNTTQEVGFQAAHSGVALILAFVSLVVIPPVAEEIMMRGFLYGSLKSRLPQYAAVIITSIIFAGAHLDEGNGGLLWTAFVQFFFLSLVLIYLREKTDSLWASITLHGFNNFIAFGTLFLWH